MDSKTLVAGLIGGAVAFLLGFLFYGVLLTDFFATNSGSATGVMRGDAEMQWVPMIIGHLAWGFLFAFIYSRWAQISTFATGAKGGAILGLLIGLTTNMINLGATHLQNLTGALADVALMTLVSALVGGTVGWYLGRKTAS